MKKIRRKAFLLALGIIGVFGGTVALVMLVDLSPYALLLALLACFSMIRSLWKCGMICYNDPIRILNKVLPKVGFTIEDEEWDKERMNVSYTGKYKEETFRINASYDSRFIFIVDLPWADLEADDSNIPRFLEAINEVNADSPNMSVILTTPTDEGKRLIYTLCKTLLPADSPEEYMEHILIDMLNRKRALHDAFFKDRPYMNQRRGPIGFAASEMDTIAPDEAAAPAAQTPTT